MTQTLYKLSALFYLGALSTPECLLASTRTFTYEDQLKVAERKVLRTQGALAESATSPDSPNLLTSAIPPQYFGRNYRVGDSWQVAALQTDSSLMRMTSNPQYLRLLARRVGIFHYQVIAVKDGPHPEFTLLVTQEVTPESRPIDPRIQSLTLTLDQTTVQTRKEYQFKGIARPIAVAPEGLRSAFTPLEMYPLDIPEVLTAEKQIAKSYPKLPPELEKLRARSAQKVDLSQSIWFEQDDFLAALFRPFGRREILGQLISVHPLELQSY